MSDMTPRIAALEPPHPPQIGEALAKWMPPGSALEPLRLFRTLAVHEGLFGRMRPVGAGILGPKATVPPPLRELMIQRTSALTGAEYEWGVHAATFDELTPAQAHSTVHGSHADPCWEPAQRAVFRLADELHRTNAVSDDLWHALDTHFDHVQILELLVTAGWYHVIAYVCNGVRIPHEDWARRFPAR